MTRRLAPLMLMWAAMAPVAHAGMVTQIESRGLLASPGTLIYGHSFNDLEPGVAGVQIRPSGVAISLQTTDKFHDHYLFSVGPVVASFITLSIDLGNVFNIDGLNVHLYDATGWLGSTLGGPSQLSAQTLLASSSAVVGAGPGEQQAITAISLAAGSYLLDVSGFVTGAAGGSYSGVLNLSAATVPAPGSAALVLLAGAAAVVAAGRNRRSKRLTKSGNPADTRVISDPHTSQRS